MLLHLSMEDRREFVDIKKMESWLVNGRLSNRWQMKVHYRSEQRLFPGWNLDSFSTRFYHTVVSITLKEQWNLFPRTK